VVKDTSCESYIFEDNKEENGMSEKNKIKRMSNAPIESWPTALLRTQVAMIHNKLFGLNILDCIEISKEYEQNELIEFIKANQDLIQEKV
jgi:hypothetical protein